MSGSNVLGAWLFLAACQVVVFLERGVARCPGLHGHPGDPVLQVQSGASVEVAGGEPSREGEPGLPVPDLVLMLNHVPFVHKRESFLFKIHRSLTALGAGISSLESCRRNPLPKPALLVYKTGDAAASTASHRSRAGSWARELLRSGTNAHLLRDNQPLLCCSSSGLLKYPGVHLWTPHLGVPLFGAWQPPPFPNVISFPFTLSWDRGHRSRTGHGGVSRNPHRMDFKLLLGHTSVPQATAPGTLSQEPAWSGSGFWSVSTPSMGPGYPSSNPQS